MTRSKELSFHLAPLSELTAIGGSVLPFSFIFVIKRNHVTNEAFLSPYYYITLNIDKLLIMRRLKSLRRSVN